MTDEYAAAFYTRPPEPRPYCEHVVVETAPDGSVICLNCTEVLIYAPALLRALTEAYPPEPDEPDGDTPIIGGGL